MLGTHSLVAASDDLEVRYMTLGGACDIGGRQGYMHSPLRKEI